jgi:hypothetical protein
MQMFRNHYINWTISLLLTLGLAANVSLPYSSNAQKTAFTQWLDRNVVGNGDEGESAIRSHIRELPHRHDSFPLLLEQATLLVVNHINDFNLPLEKKNTDTGLIGIWLFEQWSQYQDESGSMNALIPEVLKPGLKWLIHNNTFNTAIFATEASIPKADFTDSLDKILYIIQSLPIPFLSGISINAP